MMAAALTLNDEHDTGRDLFLFDTYQGLPEPTEHDTDFSGKSAADLIRDKPDAASPDRHLVLRLVARGSDQHGKNRLSRRSSPFRRR